MKSNSARLPKFRNLEPAPGGPIVQTDPYVWIPKLHGLPYWFKPFAADLVLHPFFTARATEEAIRQGLDGGAFAVQPSQWTITEIRARKNPWHPSGRLDKLTLRRNDGWRDVTLVLKFDIDGPSQVLSVIVETATKPAPPKRETKYKGPRQAGDTYSGVSGNARKHY